MHVHLAAKSSDFITFCVGHAPSLNQKRKLFSAQKAWHLIDHIAKKPFFVE